MPKIIRLCEIFAVLAGGRSSFNPAIIGFLLCEILGEKTMTEETNSIKSSTEVAPKQATPIEVNGLGAGFTKDETTEAVKILTSPEKEVKAVAEPERIMDPLGKFDYTGCQVHVIQDGESLFDVAQKYGVALQQLRYFNHVNKTNLRIRKDQKLYIPKEPVYVPAGE